MRFFLLILFYIIFLSAFSYQTRAEERVTLVVEAKITSSEFEQLITNVSEGWKRNDALAAAENFTEDAIYIEPPDRQLYKGRQNIFKFFGGVSGRKEPMLMTWHNIVFNEQKQVGIGEYTFEYKGRFSHGIVIIQISERKIRRWREYQYSSNQKWIDFVGQSNF